MSTKESSQQDPILIVGAGVSGLTLAQACIKQDIPFRIFERDDSATHRDGGWGLTIHWALPDFKALLPDELVARLPETYVNRDAVEAGEKGSFTFFDLSTGEARWQVPAADRIRVSREKLRSLLLHGVNVEWSKTLVDAQLTNDNDKITATFSDSTTATGLLLVGADGTHSAARRILHPDSHEPTELPVRLLGATASYPKSTLEPVLALDPFFLQGSDPETDAYLWFSLLSCPSKASPSEDTYTCQILTSWPHRENWLGRADPTNAPNTRSMRLLLMKQLSESWAEPFKSLVQSLPRETDVRAVELADWEPRASSGFGGRMVLVGDAAHAMVMYRGEGANHSIVDVGRFVEVFGGMWGEGFDFEAARGEFEGEVVERTGVAVGASRRACLDAHEWARIGEGSPLIKRRVMRVDLKK